MPQEYWPETNVGASVARDAPRGRRSVSQAPPPLKANTYQPLTQTQICNTNASNCSCRSA